MHLSDIREQLIKNGYLANNEIVMAVYGALGSLWSSSWSSIAGRV